MLPPQMHLNYYVFPILLLRIVVLLLFRMSSHIQHQEALSCKTHMHDEATANGVTAVVAGGS